MNDCTHPAPLTLYWPIRSGYKVRIECPKCGRTLPMNKENWNKLNWEKTA